MNLNNQVMKAETKFKHLKHIFDLDLCYKWLQKFEDSKQFCGLFQSWITDITKTKIIKENLYQIIIVFAPGLTVYYLQNGSILFFTSQAFSNSL